MATLAGNTIASTYPLLLKIDSSGIDGTLRAVEDGDGTDSALSIATDSVLVKGDGVKLYFYDADGGEHISANTGGVLSIAGASEIDLTATAIDINGTVDMSSTLVVNSNTTITTADNTDTLRLVSTDSDANVGPNLILHRDGGIGVDNDLIGLVSWAGEDDAGNETDYFFIRTQIEDASDTTEDAKVIMVTQTAGSGSERISLLGAETVINEDSNDINFRVESAANASMIFVDSGYNHMGIGTNTDYSESILRIQDSENTAFSSSATDFQAGVGTTLQIGNTSDTDNSFSQIVLRHRSTNQSGARIVSATDAANTADLNFIVEDSNTMVKAIQIDPSGEVIMAKQPAFLVQPSSAQSNIAVGSAVTKVFGTEIKDQGGDFASNTFTAPVTGMYQLNLQLRFDAIDIDADNYAIELVTSNRNYTVYYDPDGFDSDPAYWNIGMSVLADMDASDTAHITITQTAGAQQTDIDDKSFFSGYLAC